MSENEDTQTPIIDTQAQALKDLQRDNEALSRQLTEKQQALTTVQRERDDHKTAVDKLTPQAQLAAELQRKVDGYVSRERENALIEAARPKLPGAEPLAIRGVIATLAEQGKINRAPENPAAELEKLLKAIETDSPSLLRPATTGGGASAARSSSAQPKPIDPLTAVFGPRRRS